MNDRPTAKRLAQIRDSTQPAGSHPFYPDAEFADLFAEIDALRAENKRLRERLRLAHGPTERVPGTHPIGRAPNRVIEEPQPLNQEVRLVRHVLRAPHQDDAHQERREAQRPEDRQNHDAPRGDSHVRVSSNCGGCAPG